MSITLTTTTGSALAAAAGPSLEGRREERAATLEARVDGLQRGIKRKVPSTKIGGRSFEARTGKQLRVLPETGDREVVIYIGKYPPAYQKAIEQGNIKGLLESGLACKDKAEALKRLQQAADLGNSEAQNHLEAAAILAGLMGKCS